MRVTMQQICTIEINTYQRDKKIKMKQWTVLQKLNNYLYLIAASTFGNRANCS